MPAPRIADAAREQQADARQIHELERRGAHMTPQERLRATVLKKQRLATKDELYALRLR